MFEDLQKNQSDKVDDIFAESDKSENQLNKKPASFSNPNSTKPPVNSLNDSLAEFEEEESNKSGKIVKTIFLIIFILAIIGISAYFVYSKILLPKTLNQENSLDQNIPLENENIVDNNIVDNNIVDNDFADNDIIDDNNINNDIIDGDIVATTSEEDLVVENGEENNLETIDSDGDGLSDYDEIYIYGTNPYIIDTDGDGLSDYDEVMIFGTDPLISDTDADTYLDGEEVFSGHNPLGEGKINIDLFVNKELFIENYPELVIK